MSHRWTSRPTCGRTPTEDSPVRRSTGHDHPAGSQAVEPQFPVDRFRGAEVDVRQLGHVVGREVDRRPRAHEDAREVLADDVEVDETASGQRGALHRVLQGGDDRARVEVVDEPAERESAAFHRDVLNEVMVREGQPYAIERCEPVLRLHSDALPAELGQMPEVGIGPQRGT
ncbi:hypothetical protein PLANTIT3_50181 [Plantibacter sp. T3]|nr:hypothetical protein PLANTIT3_50181 [Plantibacter sp. T3]